MLFCIRRNEHFDFNEFYYFLFVWARYKYCSTLTFYIWCRYVEPFLCSYLTFKVNVSQIPFCNAAKMMSYRCPWHGWQCWRDYMFLCPCNHCYWWTTSGGGGTVLYSLRARLSEQRSSLTCSCFAAQFCAQVIPPRDRVARLEKSYKKCSSWYTQWINLFRWLRTRRTGTRQFTTPLVQIMHHDTAFVLCLSVLHVYLM